MMKQINEKTITRFVRRLRGEAVIPFVRRLNERGAAASTAATAFTAAATKAAVAEEFK